MTTPPQPPPPPPPGGGAVPPAGYANDDEKTWALLIHFGGALLWFIAPLVGLLAKGNQSPTIRAHAVEALNFHITWNVAWVIATILATCTLGVLFFLPILVWIFIVIIAIVAGVKAIDGTLFKYPVKITLVK